MATSLAYNVDCMEYMKTVPDGYFDLAVVDPPYGDGSSQFVQVERERERPDEPDTDKGRIAGNRTGHGASQSGEPLEPLRSTVRPIQTRYVNRGGGTVRTSIILAV